MVMWTGARVISKTLNVGQLEELSRVLKRQPVIWDNLTANDFDSRRVFLGPYDGRSTDIKKHIRGVLSNPNCEYEANFITLHTISQWSKCDEDANEYVEEEATNNTISNFSNLTSNAYHSRRALKLAIEAWLPEFNRFKNVFPRPSDIITKPLSSVLTSLTTATTTTTSSSISESANLLADDELIRERNNQIFEDLNNAIKDGIPFSAALNSDSTFQPITKQLTNSLLDPPVIFNPLEPMDLDKDCLDVNNSISNINNNNGSSQQIDANMEELIQTTVKDLDCNVETSSSEEMQTEQQIDTSTNEFSYEDINFFIDLFYLPFEHGSNGLQLLNEFNWLLNNAIQIANYHAKKALNSEKSPDVIEWFDRAVKFEKTSIYVTSLLSKLNSCKNRCVKLELFPYLWDICSVINLLNTFIKWLSLGHISIEQPILQTTVNWFSKGYREAFENGEQEPWLFRGGISGDLQRLLPIDSLAINDLFLYKSPDSSSSHHFNIRHFQQSDEQSVYYICRKASLASTDDYLFKDVPDLIGDKFVGSFLTLSPDFCFVIEDEMEENKICCGYILAAIDSQQFQKKCEMAWNPDICLKYKAPIEKLNKGEKLTSVEQMINDLHDEQKRKFIIPEIVYNSYPSICRIGLLDYVQENDLSAAKRLLACLLAALRVNGSKGIFSIVDGVKDKRSIDFYLKLGFTEILCPKELKLNVDDVYLGRSF